MRRKKHREHKKRRHERALRKDEQRERAFYQADQEHLREHKLDRNAHRRNDVIGENGLLDKYPHLNQNLENESTSNPVIYPR